MRQLPPPKDFSPDERDVWSAAQRQLRAQGTWTGRSDLPLLESYCRNVVLARTARRAIADMPTPLERDTNTGMMAAAGKLKVAESAEAAAHKFATALLLTPEARKRHGIQDIAEGAQRELNALVSQGRRP